MIAKEISEVSEEILKPKEFIQFLLETHQNDVYYEKGLYGTVYQIR